MNYSKMTKAELIELVCERTSKRVAGPEGVLDEFMPWATEKQECFLVTTLDAANQVIKTRLVSKGIVNRVLVHPREIFCDAITDRACGIIVAHNHPSGNMTPSTEDLQVTKRLMQAGDIIGIPVMDHVIFHGAKFYSMKEKGDL